MPEQLTKKQAAKKVYSSLGVTLAGVFVAILAAVVAVAANMMKPELFGDVAAGVVLAAVCTFLLNIARVLSKVSSDQSPHSEE